MVGAVPVVGARIVACLALIVGGAAVVHVGLMHQFAVAVHGFVGFELRGACTGILVAVSVFSGLMAELFGLMVFFSGLPTAVIGLAAAIVGLLHKAAIFLAGCGPVSGCGTGPVVRGYGG